MGLIDITKIPAVYINLEKHNQKNDNMYNLLSSIGFENIERIEGVLDAENPVAGCSKAHHKALSSFKAPFVLFEDDCVLFDQNKVTKIDFLSFLFLKNNEIRNNERIIFKIKKAIIKKILI